MKTLLAIPCFDSVAVGFAASLMGLRTVGTIVPYFNSGSLIYDSRNQLGNMAVQQGCDHILWLDSDMLFEPDLMEKLLSHDKDFVSGIYFTRRTDTKPCFFKTVDAKQQDDGSVLPIAEHYWDYPKDSLFEIDGCGFGAVLMKTKMFEDVAKKYGLPFSPVLGFGEDISFCMKAKQLGYKMYCDSSVKLGHVKHGVVSEEDYIFSMEQSVGKQE